jgi:signal transduction histidine kinase
MGTNEVPATGCADPTDSLSMRVLRLYRAELAPASMAGPVTSLFQLKSPRCRNDIALNPAPRPGLPDPDLPGMISLSIALRIGARVLTVAGLLLVQGIALAGEVLTDIREIRALPPERAAGELPVVLRGIITRLTAHELFLQDGAEAIFVGRRRHDPALRMGDYVEVRGVTERGHLIPMIKWAELTTLGHHSLPPPKILRPWELASVWADCQWVEVAGTVQTAERRPGGVLDLHLLYEDSLLRIEIDEPSACLSAQLIGARVRLRGVISGAKTPERKLVEPVLWVADRPDTFIIEAPGPDDLFTMPSRTIATLHVQNTAVRSGELVRVAATVTAQPLPDLVFVSDIGRSLEIRLQRPGRFAPGDRIEVVGFPEMGLVQTVLRHAVARRLAGGEPPAPRPCGTIQLLDFRHEAELVEVSGELREILRQADGLTLLLMNEGKALNVDIAARQVPESAILPPVGSRVSLAGVCSIERVTPPNNYQIVAPAAVRLRLRSFDDLVVLARPPWWTPARLLAALALLGMFAVGAVGWIWTLNRRVQVQTRIILGNVQKQAVLEERNRIAREFHDSLEQQIAGTTILLDAVDTVLEQPARAREGLSTARAMLRHSLDEAQQAVSDLRSNDLIERDLGPLIEQAVRERLSATGIQPIFRRDGTWPDLDTMVKQHLLRIVQESVTNAAKHAAPQHITVSMHAARDRVEVEVADDGCGFDVSERLRGPGQFGLIGLKERAEKIGARLSIQSAPARGTTVAVTLPLGAPAPI